MKRVLIFSLAYVPHVGGAEIALKEITERITDVEFDMITLRLDDKDPLEEIIGTMHVHRISGSKNFFPFKALVLASKLHRKEAYDATWAMMANWAGFAALFFKWKYPQVPFLLTLQEGDSFEYIRKRIGLMYPLFKKIFVKADVITVISNYLGDWARSMGAKARIILIPNGVDTEIFSEVISEDKRKIIRDILGADKARTVLVTASRLVSKNGVDDIVRALADLPQCTLLVLGTGKEEAKLRALAKDLHVEDRIVWKGFVSHEELPMYLQASDIFIRPSLSEGMGNAFIEAMAAGIPVIATPVGGIVDFLKDGETGFFCKVKDPQSIAMQVQKIVGNPELKNAVIHNAKKMVVERYDWDLIAHDMKEKVFDVMG